MVRIIYNLNIIYCFINAANVFIKQHLALTVRLQIAMYMFMSQDLAILLR